MFKSFFVNPGFCNLLDASNFLDFFHLETGRSSCGCIQIKSHREVNGKF